MLDDGEHHNLDPDANKALEAPWGATRYAPPMTVTPPGHCFETTLIMCIATVVAFSEYITSFHAHGTLTWKYEQ